MGLYSNDSLEYGSEGYMKKVTGDYRESTGNLGSSVFESITGSESIDYSNLTRQQTEDVAKRSIGKVGGFFRAQLESNSVLTNDSFHARVSVASEYEFIWLIVMVVMFLAGGVSYLCCSRSSSIHRKLRSEGKAGNYGTVGDCENLTDNMKAERDSDILDGVMSESNCGDADNNKRRDVEGCVDDYVQTSANTIRSSDVDNSLDYSPRTFHRSFAYQKLDDLGVEVKFE